MFTEIDVAHMKRGGMDLSSYEDVKKHADAIHQTVSEGTMPPPGTGERWTLEMCATFKAWQEAGYPE